MAGYSTEYEVIKAYIADNWTTTNVYYANTVNRDKSDSYLRVTVINGKSNAMNIGGGSGANARKSYPGIIDIAIFVKLATGKEVALGYADTLIDLFKYASLGTNISCQNAYIDNEQENSTSGWFQLNVSIEFFRREI